MGPTPLRENIPVMATRNLRQVLLSVLLAATLAAASASGVGAVVRYEPTPRPTPIPPQAGGRVEVTWAGLAVTFPADWQIRVKSEPDISTGGAAILTAFGPGDAACTIDLYDPEAVETWRDAGIEPALGLAISGLSAERFDDLWGGGATGVSAYTVYADGLHYSLLCVAPVAPADRWLAIAETIEVFAPVPSD